MVAEDPKATRRGPGGEVPAGSPETRLSEAFRNRFEIHSTLGAGGMGTVYLATDKSLERSVAIKFSRALDAESRIRFAREGRVLARLRHPNVIQVYDTGEEDGAPYLVIEVVDGAPLSDRFPIDGAFDVMEGLEVGRQIAAGLASAHAEGVLHRDLKSSNVLLTADGSVKICDFGLAREASGADRVTAAGAFLGTPEYLAPEVIEGEPPTPASDIYALGCVLMEMLTGEPPFPALSKEGARRSIAEIVSAHLKEPVPVPSDRTFGLSDEIDALIVQCLAKSPADRPRSAAAIEQILAHEARKAAVRSHVRLKVASDRRARMVREQPAAEATGSAAKTRSAQITAKFSGVRPSSDRNVPPAARRPPSWKYLLASAVAAGLLAALVSVTRMFWLPHVPVVRVRVPGGITPIGTNGNGFPEYLYGKDGSLIVQIPGGSFERGSAAGEPDERPVRLITISPYFIGKSPVTRKQYAVFCKSTGRALPEPTSWKVADDHPVVNVTWNDAAAYCAWAGLRLPTEAEWEFAARGFDGRRYPWGNEPPDGGGAYRANYNPGHPARDGYEYTSPAGIFSPGSPLPRADGSSPFGVLDLSGNVCQWCADWHDQRYYERSPEVDPENKTRASNRILRGGAYFTKENKYLRTSYRYSLTPTKFAEYVGFRVAW